MSTQEIATRTPIQELVASVRSADFERQVALALPEGVKPERFVRVMVTALLDNPDLGGVDSNSVFQAGLRCAADGLLPDGREAAFVRFNDKKKGPVAVYMSMIGGLRKIAAEFGWSLRTRVVYENDTFEHELGLDETLTHHPTRPGLERGAMVAAYAVATHKDGRKEIEVVYAEDVAKARAVSRAKDFGPWVDWPERMWEKTAGRRLFAKLPLGERERDKIERVLGEGDAVPAAEQLYAPQARTTEVPPREENGTEQAAGETGPGAEQDSSSSETDGTPPPAAAEWQIANSFGVDAYEVITPDGEVIGGYESHAEAEAAIARFIAEAKAEPVEDGDFTIPAEAAADADVQAANEAAEAIVPFGKHKGTSLKDLVALGDEGAGRIRWALKSWKTEPFLSAVWAFAKVYAPDLYEAAKAEEETA